MTNMKNCSYHMIDHENQEISSFYNKYIVLKSMFVNWMGVCTDL